MSGDGDARRRLLGAAARCGFTLGDDDAERLAGLVERVEAGVAGGSGEGGDVGMQGSAVASRAPNPANSSGGDGSGWVWRAGEAGEAGEAGAATPAAADVVDGPLDGWRLAVKDLIAVGGRPLRCGSAATFDAPPEAADAPVVARLRRAAALLVGTTRLHEFAFGTIGVDRAFGMPVNPVDPERVPGGSSSGAAVVVARGEADLSLGTDTGGSVRIPAALCGVVGLKPGYGAVSTAGVVALAPSLDHVGFLVASPTQLVAPAQVLGLVGADDPPPVRRLGVARGAVEACEPEVAGAFEQALERLRRAGLELVDVDWPGGEEVFAATTALMYAEAAHGHRRRLSTRAHLYGEDVRNRVLQGLALDAVTYLAARDLQAELRQRCLDVLSTVDAVATPTVPVLAPRTDAVADPAVAARLVTFTRLADLAGLPAVSIPLPPVPERRGGGGPALPVGLQIEAATDTAVIGAALTLDRLGIGAAA